MSKNFFFSLMKRTKNLSCFFHKSFLFALSQLPWHCSSPFFKFNSQPPSFASLDLLNLRANKFRAWNTINNKIWLVLLSAATRLFWLGRSIERFACRCRSVSISNSRIFWDKFVSNNYICLSYYALPGGIFHRSSKTYISRSWSYETCLFILKYLFHQTLLNLWTWYWYKAHKVLFSYIFQVCT